MSRWIENVVENDNKKKRCGLKKVTKTRLFYCGYLHISEKVIAIFYLILIPLHEIFESKKKRRQSVSKRDRPSIVSRCSEKIDYCHD